jgi:hypothetical protein
LAEERKQKHRENDSEDLREMRVRRDSPVSGARDAFLELKQEIGNQLRNQLDPGVDRAQRSQLRPFVHDRLDAMLGERGVVLNRGEKRQLLEAIVADLISS